jgi:hypothetical protein
MGKNAQQLIDAVKRALRAVVGFLDNTGEGRSSGGSRNGFTASAVDPHDTAFRVHGPVRVFGGGINAGALAPALIVLWLRSIL